MILNKVHIFLLCALFAVKSESNYILQPLSNSSENGNISAASPVMASNTRSIFNVFRPVCIAKRLLNTFIERTHLNETTGSCYAISFAKIVENTG